MWSRLDLATLGAEQLKVDPFHNHFICFEISQHPSDDLHRSVRQEL